MTASEKLKALISDLEGQIVGNASQCDIEFLNGRIADINAVIPHIDDSISLYQNARQACAKAGRHDLIRKSMWTV